MTRALPWAALAVIAGAGGAVTLFAVGEDQPFPIPSLLAALAALELSCATWAGTRAVLEAWPSLVALAHRLRGERWCHGCGYSKSVREETVSTSFDYLIEDDEVIPLSLDMLVIRCGACGESWTDYRGERQRERRVQEYLESRADRDNVKNEIRKQLEGGEVDSFTLTSEVGRRCDINPARVWPVLREMVEEGLVVQREGEISSARDHRPRIYFRMPYQVTR